MPRKRYNTKDKNHWIPRDFLRYRCGGFETVEIGGRRVYTANYQGHRVYLWDTSDFGGMWLDWMLLCVDTETMFLLEVKTEEAYAAKDHSLKPGEKWTFENLPDQSRFVVTDDDMQDIMTEVIEVSHGK